MQNESQNNPSSWKDNLESWDGLAEESLDKTAAWNKLHNRLQKKDNSKKVIRYWAAAASFIIMLFIGNIIHLKKELPIGSNSHPTKEKIWTSPQVIDSSPVILTPAITETKKTVVLKVENKQHTPLLSAETIPNFEVAKQDEEFPTIAPTISSEIPDTTAVVTVTAKKRLRVIHINELGKPIEDLNPFVKNNVISSNQKSPLSGNTSSRITLTTNSSDNILKIKLSPTN